MNKSRIDLIDIQQKVLAAELEQRKEAIIRDRRIEMEQAAVAGVQHLKYITELESLLDDENKRENPREEHITEIQKQIAAIQSIL